MFRIYLVVLFVLLCDSVASQNIQCFGNDNLLSTHIDCDKKVNNTVQDKYGKKGFQNPYVGETRFNHIVVDGNNK